MTAADLALLAHLADPDHPLALANPAARAALAALLAEHAGFQIQVVRLQAERERMKYKLDDTGRVLINELNRSPAPKPKLSLIEAQESRRCRICAGPIFGLLNKMEDGPVMLNYGKEYAHSRCLEAASEAPR